MKRSFNAISSGADEEIPSKNRRLELRASATDVLTYATMHQQCLTDQGNGSPISEELKPAQFSFNQYLAFTRGITDPSCVVYADLDGVDLHDANSKAFDLSDADLSHVKLRRARMNSVALDGAILTGTDLNEADLSEADLSRADLSGADLRYANLSKAILCDADLSHADASHANFYKAISNGATLTSAILRKANMADADLRETRMDGADLSRARLMGADIAGANLNDTKPEIDVSETGPEEDISNAARWAARMASRNSRGALERG